jgi:hypothetical protein
MLAAMSFYSTEAPSSILSSSSHARHTRQWWLVVSLSTIRFASRLVMRISFRRLFVNISQASSNKQLRGNIKSK